VFCNDVLDLQTRLLGSLEKNSLIDETKKRNKKRELVDWLLNALSTLAQASALLPTELFQQLEADVLRVDFELLVVGMIRLAAFF
jgi:hypothetical protein